MSGFEWAWIYYGYRPFARGNLQSRTLDLVTRVNLVRGKSLRSRLGDVVDVRTVLNRAPGPIIRSLLQVLVHARVVLN